MPTGRWSFLTNHGKALVFLAREPDARLRTIADALGVTERTAHGIVADLADAGFVIKERAGRRNVYHIQKHLPLPDNVSRDRTIGEVLDLLAAARPPADSPDRRDPAGLNTTAAT